jgi:hypothetical protein
LLTNISPWLSYLRWRSLPLLWGLLSDNDRALLQRIYDKEILQLLAFRCLYDPQTTRS